MGAKDENGTKRGAAKRNATRNALKSGAKGGAKSGAKGGAKSVNCKFGFWGNRFSGTYTHEQIRNALILLEHPDYDPTDTQSFANLPLDKCPSPSTMCQTMKQKYPELFNSRIYQWFVGDTLNATFGRSWREFRERWIVYGVTCGVGFWLVQSFELYGWLLPRNSDGSLRNTSSTFWNARRRQNRIAVEKITASAKNRMLTLYREANQKCSAHSSFRQDNKRKCESDRECVWKPGMIVGGTCTTTKKR